MLYCYPLLFHKKISIVEKELIINRVAMKKS